MSKPPRVLRQTHFVNERLARVGLEVLTLAKLRAWGATRFLAEPERVEFCMVLVITAGQGEHIVDFERIALKPGSVVIIRPGQVQQWRLREGLEGDCLLIAPQVMHPSAATTTAATGHPSHVLSLDAWPTTFTLSPDERRHWRALMVILKRELDQPVVDDLSAALARELYLCLMLRLTRAARQDAQAPSASELLYHRFQRELEGMVATRPSVEALAQRLCVSPTTLSRACHATGGRSAKAVIDRRIAMEAQRMLVHSGATSATIGEQLGFSEPTNFLKFFKRQLGMTPEAFRVLHRLA